jgi:hypothetical protein
MTDVLYLAVFFAGFAGLTWGLIVLCDLVRGGDR